VAPREIEEFFHAKIPLTAAMRVRVESWDERQLVVTAPLEPNHNHLGTAFGGSLAALLVLAGYGLLWLELGDAESHIVVRKSSFEYLLPVKGSLRAICPRPSREVMDEFKQAFARRGKARLELHATIEHEGKTAVEFRGLFVALRPQG